MLISRCCHARIYIVENVDSFYVCSACKIDCDTMDVSFRNEGSSHHGQGDVREA